jgi:hypothetical protein
VDPVDVRIVAAQPCVGSGKEDGCMSAGSRSQDPSQVPLWTVAALAAFMALPSNMTALRLAIFIPALLLARKNREPKSLDWEYHGLYLALLLLGLFLNIYDGCLNEKHWELMGPYVFDVAIYWWISWQLVQIRNYLVVLWRAVWMAIGAITLCHLVLIGLAMSNRLSDLQSVVTSLQFQFGQNQDHGFFAYSSILLVPMMYLLPCGIALHCLDPHRWSLSRFCWLTFCILVAVTSLRLALIIGVSLSLLCSSLIGRTRKLPNVSGPRAAIAAAILGAAGISIACSPTAVALYDLKLAQKVDRYDPRYDQALAWLTYWSQAPLLGNGLSSVTMTATNEDGSVTVMRSGRITNDYGFELLPLQMLTEIGLIGIGGYAAFVWYTNRQLKRAARRLQSGARQNLDYATIVSARLAMLCFLIATCTNGYLLSFNGLFPLFIPLGLSWLVLRRVPAAPSKASRALVASNAGWPRVCGGRQRCEMGPLG